MPHLVQNFGKNFSREAQLRRGKPPFWTAPFQTHHQKTTCGFYSSKTHPIRTKDYSKCEESTEFKKCKLRISIYNLNSHAFILYKLEIPVFKGFKAFWVYNLYSIIYHINKYNYFFKSFILIGFATCMV